MWTNFSAFHFLRSKLTFKNKTNKQNKNSQTNKTTKKPHQTPLPILFIILLAKNIPMDGEETFVRVMTASTDFES